MGLEEARRVVEQFWPSAASRQEVALSQNGQYWTAGRPTRRLPDVLLIGPDGGALIFSALEQSLEQAMGEYAAGHRTLLAGSANATPDRSIPREDGN